MAPPPLESIAALVERARALPQGAPESSRAGTVYAVVLDCSLPRRTRGSGAWRKRWGCSSGAPAAAAAPLPRQLSPPLL